MSQVSIVDIAGNNPQIPTQFNANVGFAIPIGNVLEILGEAVAAGVNPVRTNASGNTVTTQVQRSQAIAASNASNVGLAAFDSTKFTVDSNGFVSTLGSGVLNTLTGNDGVVVVPTAGNINVVGSGSITITGSGSTETVQLFGLTAFNVLVGAGTSTITKIAPSVTSGVPLISQGSLANPVFGTTVVAGGGTGRVTLTNHGVLVGAGTNAITQLAAGTAGQMLQSGGAAADPAYSTATYPSTATSTGTILRANGTNWVATTATYPTTTTVSQILYSSATNVIGGITTANNTILTTNASGVPLMTTALGGDFGFTSSTAGVARTLTVSNSNNSSTSTEAIFIASVGGTSAGDPWLRFAVGSTRSYSIGIDNSDTQSFTINTAANATVSPSTGTNVMRIDNSGNVSKPLNACCTADLNTGLTNATGDATFINPVIFDTDTGSFFDQNGNYDTTTGVFTANATGKYLVTARVTFNGLGALFTSGILRIDLNGGAYCINQFNPGIAANAANEFTAQISCILPVAATGTIAVLAQVSGSTKTVGVKGATAGSFTSLSIVLVS